MTSNIEEFEHNDGVWKVNWQTPKGCRIKVFVIGDSDLMGSQATRIQLQRLKMSIDEFIEKASHFASNSQYRDDISLEDGLVANSVVVDTWDDVKIWFALGVSERMIGVRMHEDKPVDVFCDH